MRSELTNWLNSDQDYDLGIELLQKYSNSQFLINLLSPGPDSFNTAKLLRELTRLRDQAEPEPMEQTPADLQVLPADKTYRPDDRLEKKMRIDSMIRQLWKEMTHLHGKLTTLPEGEQLLQTARTILEKNLKRQDLWDQLHYYTAHGVFFDELAENQPKPFDLEQEIKNLMASRSKAKKIISKPLPDAKRKHQLQRIEKLTDQIEKLKVQRNGKG